MQMGEPEAVQREAEAAHDRSPPSSSSDGVFDCNICMDTASEPVVTLCGHLYCWQCIYKWLQLRQHCQTCPICKSSISTMTMIPIYGRGRPQVDPRCRSIALEPIPKRPPGRRPLLADAAETTSHTEAEARDPLPFDYLLRQQQPRPNALGPAGGHAGSFSAGLSIFPSLFGLQLVTPPQHAESEEAVLSAEQAQQIFLSRLLLLLGCFVILCLLLF
eukprot:CAMPEP_0183359914 /NCGR_PEP_ID=MMETSP0164_2-20130417/53725_1 /TAXON_ID=221442 /ORGANISM="Coccolithus pelagicus ssp braarudi, Strain PLY182g" /LENGTH=216 /DNA_ID=CAMNT_0025534139 /DNA_START=202 /DNA_END=852 /DNA_ORIENTATION=+